MKFNENLKYLRKRERITQEQLAEKLNVSRQAVTKWESGQSLPDIENLKEIAYIFSVSIDSLVGDIESKSTAKIKKKINDIGYFIFGIVILILVQLISVGDFIKQIVNNEDIVIVSFVIMGVMGFIILLLEIKLYLKDTSEEILDMTQTENGRKKRKKNILKKSYINIVTWSIFSLITNVNLIPLGITRFLKSFIENLIIGLVLTVLISIVEYRKIEKEVIKLNKEDE